MAEPGYSTAITAISLVTFLLGFCSLCRQSSPSIIRNAYLVQSLIQMLNEADFHGHKLSMDESQL